MANRWRLERVLGVGGTASVFEARHRNGKRVAIKILHPELALVSDACKRFLREGYLANAVEHPGVVSVLDDGVTDDGLPFLVMELLDGESLDGRLERLGRPLSVADVLSIGVAMLEVLSEAHRKGVVHRDLKPDNVFLCADGSVKILDFGIARILREVSTTRVGMTVGTPTFMSREQARGPREKLDGRADLWSVGATLFYALTREFLYEARTVAEFLTALVTCNPRRLRELSPGVPEPIAAVIEGALQHDLQRRWQEAEAMRAALLEAAQQAGLAVPERPSPEGFVLPRPSQHRLPSFPDDLSLSLPEEPRKSHPSLSEDSELMSWGAQAAPGAIRGSDTPIPKKVEKIKAHPSTPPKPAPGLGQSSAVTLSEAVAGDADRAHRRSVAPGRSDRPPSASTAPGSLGPSGVVVTCEPSLEGQGRARAQWSEGRGKPRTPWLLVVLVGGAWLGLGVDGSWQRGRGPESVVVASGAATASEASAGAMSGAWEASGEGACGATCAEQGATRAVQGAPSATREASNRAREVTGGAQAQSSPGGAPERGAKGERGGGTSRLAPALRGDLGYSRH